METLVTVEASGKSVHHHMTAREISPGCDNGQHQRHRPPWPVRIALAAVIEGLGLIVRQAPAHQTPSPTPPQRQPVLVEAAGDKEIRERTIIASGVKMLLWLGGENISAWKCTYDELMVGKKNYRIIALLSIDNA